MIENFAVFVLVAVYIALAVTVRCYRARIRRRAARELAERFYATENLLWQTHRDACATPVKPNTKDLYS